MSSKKIESVVQKIEEAMGLLGKRGSRPAVEAALSAALEALRGLNTSSSGMTPEALIAAAFEAAVGREVKVTSGPKKGQSRVARLVPLDHPVRSALRAEVYEDPKRGLVARVQVARDFYRAQPDVAFWAIAYLGEGARCLGHWAHHGVADKVGYLDLSLEPMKPK